MKKTSFSIETIDGIPVAAFVTRKNEIMIELVDGNSPVTVEDVYLLVKARGFNTCLSLENKQDFAKKYASFEKIIIKKEWYDDSGVYDYDETSLKDLKDDSVFRVFFNKE